MKFPISSKCVILSRFISEAVLNFPVFISATSKSVSKVNGLIVIVSVLMFSCANNNKGGIEAINLRCDYRENPMGIDDVKPKLSWTLQAEEKNQKQSAFHILVSSSPDNLEKNKGDIWDSRKIKSEQSVHIPYNGIRLESGKRYYWKVKVWDKRKRKSGWSEPAYWEMGLLNETDWKASWIFFESETSPLFRKEIDIDKPLKDARAYISGLGYYELSINGEKIGDHVLDPGQTDYEQRTFYVVYDVTKELKQGLNAVGIMLGNGWYNQTSVNHGKYGWTDVVYGHPRLIFQIELTFKDGTRKLVLSDTSWNASAGPIVSDNIYAGETYDARLEQDGWNKAGFDDTSWMPAMISEGPGGKLVCQNIPPIKKMQIIRPVNITNPEPGVYVYDMGQNFAGWCRLKVNGSAGTEVRMRFAEWIGKDGMIDPGSTGFYATGVIQTDRYICKGNGIETWEPRFTYHGFQYVELTGFPGKPSLDDLEGIVVHTALKKSGEFDCSDSMLNRLHKTALWTEISNLHSIPTDCPHRERCGWLGDVFLTSDMISYNFDAALFLKKFIEDIETSRQGGMPTDISPGRRFGGRNPDWGTAFIQLVWNTYLYYADGAVIDKHYDGMKFIMDNLEKMAVDHIIYRGIGSIFSPGRIMPLSTPVEFTTTALFYFCADVMSRMAIITHRKEDADKYLNLCDSIKYSFNNKFFDQEKKTYGSQEKNTLALAFELAPYGAEQKVAENLNWEVMEINKGHVLTGVFGTRYIYAILGQYGYFDTLDKLFHSNEYPGYGYLFSRGATTFWENWGELKFADRKGPGDDRSKNHPFQGGFDAWFYYGIAGINPDPELPGFKHIILKPQIIKPLDYAKAEFNSVYGKIKSEWELQNDHFTWSIEIPVNSDAEIYIPSPDDGKILENGRDIREAKEITFLRREGNYSIFKAGSGKYRFDAKYLK